MEAKQEHRQEQKARLWLLAALIRQKKLPDFKKFIGVEEKPQTWQEMRDHMKAMAGNEPKPRRTHRP